MDIRSIDLTIDYDMFYEEVSNGLYEQKVPYEKVQKIIKSLRDEDVAVTMDPNKFINVHFRVKAHEFD